MQKKKIIDYGELETPIKAVEQILNQYDLEEKQLIMKMLSQRLSAVISKQRLNDNLSSNPMYSMAMKMLGNKDKEGEC